MRYSSLPDAHTHFAPKLHPDSSYRGSIIILNSTTPSEWSELESEYGSVSHLRLQFGIHPWYAGTNWSTNLLALEEFLMRNLTAGIGEVGLDNIRSGLSITEQQSLLEELLALAFKYNRVVSIHCVRAYSQLKQSFKRLGANLPDTILHDFIGTTEDVAWFLGRGAYFSVGNALLKKRSAEIITYIAPERRLVESDFDKPPSGSHTDAELIEKYQQKLLQNYNEVASLLNCSVVELAKSCGDNIRALLNVSTV